jgi:hypothetical protein
MSKCLCAGIVSKVGMLMEPHSIHLPPQSFQKKKEKTEKKKKESFLPQSLMKKNKGSDQNFSLKVA